MAKDKSKQDDWARDGEISPTDADFDSAESLAGKEAASEGNSLLEQLRADLEGAKERVLRSQAELENYRKRAARRDRRTSPLRQPAAHPRSAAGLGQYRAAINAAENTHDAASLLEGIKMVLPQFESVLKRHHCERIPALHQPFNPHCMKRFHSSPTTTIPPNTVLFVAQPGFQLFDRIVRPSQVIVSAASREGD